MIPFTPSPPPLHVFPESHRTLAEKLAVTPWPDADREMRVMKAQSQGQYLAELCAKVHGVTRDGMLISRDLIDGVPVAEIIQRHCRLSAELFWDQQLVVLNDDTLRRLA